MATQVEELYVTLNARTEGFEQSLNKASRQGAGYIGELKNSFKSLVTGPFAAGAILTTVGVAFTRTIQAADELDASVRRLSGAARISGVPLATLRDIADSAREAFGLSTITSNDFSTEITKLTSKAGDITKSKDALAAFLEIGAARGLSAADTLKAVQQAVLGIDEGTDKLFNKNPSVLYQEYADAIGTTAGKLTDQQKAQALLDAALRDGEKVRGSYQDYLQSAAGQQAQLTQQLEEASAEVGRALGPLRLLVLQGLGPLLQVATPILKFLAGFVTVLAQGVNVQLQQMRLGLGFVTQAIGKLIRNDDLANWGKRQSDAARGAIESSTQSVLRTIGLVDKATETVGLNDAAMTTQIVQSANTRAAATKRAINDEAAAERAWRREQQEALKFYISLQKQVREGITQLNRTARQTLTREAFQEWNDSTTQIKLDLDDAWQRLKNDFPDGFDTTSRSAEVTRAIIRDVKNNAVNAAEGALGLAASFGLVNADAERVLQNVINIADALPKALGGSFSGVLGVVGGLASAIKVLAGGDRAGQQLLRDNNRRLAELRDEIGNLDLNVSGEDFSAVRTALDTFETTRLINQALGGDRDGAFRALTQLLGAQGLTVGDAQRVAQELGLSLFDRDGRLNFQALNQLFTALGAVEFGQFGTSFTDQLRSVQSSFDVFGTGTAGQASALAALFGQFSPALAGLDTTDLVGTRLRLQDLFTQLQSGQLTAADFGGLTGTQFLDAITTLLDLIRTLEDDARETGAAVTGEVASAVGSSVAAATGAQTETLSDLLAAIRAAGERAADALETLLTAPALGLIAPPAVDGVASASLGGGGLSVTVQITGPIYGDGAEDVGGRIGRAIAQELDAALGATRVAARRAAGDPALLS